MFIIPFSLRLMRDHYNFDELTTYINIYNIYTNYICRCRNEMNGHKQHSNKTSTPGFFQGRLFAVYTHCGCCI